MFWRTVAVLLAWAAAQPAAAVDADTGEVAANWKRHEVDFVYMGFTTRYSCDGLRDKVRLLLQHAGVRPDLRVWSRGCPQGPGRIADFPRVRAVFWAPSLPQPQAQAARREAFEPAVGVWREVTIRRGKPRGIEPGDCELVEQFRDRLLPELTTRAVADDTHCVPHQLVGNRIDLRFQVLQGLLPPDYRPAQGR